MGFQGSSSARLALGLTTRSSHPAMPRLGLLPGLVWTNVFPWEFKNPHAFISGCCDDQHPGGSRPWCCSAEVTNEAGTPCPGGARLWLRVGVCLYTCVLVLWRVDAGHAVMFLPSAAPHMVHQIPPGALVPFPCRVTVK